MHYSIIFTIKIVQTKIVLIILNLVITGICKTRYDKTIEKKTKYLRTVFKEKISIIFNKVMEVLL